MKRSAPIILLALFSIIVPQQTLAATPIKVSAILVKTNDWEKPCSGGLFAVELDLSQRRDKMYNCGMKTLISKKLEGTIQLQVLNNQTWEDFDQSNHWFPTSKSYFNSQNRHTYSYPLKLKSHHYGEITKDGRIKFLDKKSTGYSGADWLSGPRPYSQEYVVGGDVYDATIREIKLRVKVVSGTNEYFSNGVTYTYTNHSFFTVALDKYGYKQDVPRSGSDASGSNSASSAVPQASGSTSTTRGSQTSKLPVCTGAQEANLINLLSQGIATNRMISTYRDYLAKTINDLGNAYARDAKYDMEKLTIEKKSLETKLEELYKSSENLKIREKGILATCSRQSENSSTSSSTNQNRKPCTENEISRLLVMISQYSSKQELIRISRLNIEKLKVDLSFAISTGKNAGTYQAAIQRYSRLLEADLGSASLIKREFEALNGGCLNSNLALP